MKFINFKKIKSCFGGEINVLKNWKMIVIGFVIFLIIVVFVDGYVFWKYQKELSRPAETGGVKFTAIDRTSLQEIVDWLNIKKENFNKNLVAPEIKDPSL